MDDWFSIGMKQIADSYGRPYIFSLGHSTRGLWLRDAWAHPAYKWSPGYEFVFSLSPRTKG